MNVNEEVSKIGRFIQKFIIENQFSGAIVGISGGIDSAVVASLCVRSIGNNRVFGLILPERDSSPQSIKDAKRVCEFLNIKYEVRNITSILRKLGIYKLYPPVFLISSKVKEKYTLSKWKELSDDPYIDDLNNIGNEEFLKGLAYYRAKHRVRMCVMYFEAEKRGYSVIGTTNKTELFTGLYVKWGDEAVDLEPIAHLYKTQVFELAKELDIPSNIIKKSPSPDLVPGITDEYVFNMSYLELDRILQKIEKKEDLIDEDPNKVERVKRILKYTFKRKLKAVSIKD